MLTSKATSKACRPSGHLHWLWWHQTFGWSRKKDARPVLQRTHLMVNPENDKPTGRITLAGSALFATTDTSSAKSWTLWDLVHPAVVEHMVSNGIQSNPMGHVTLAIPYHGHGILQKVIPDSLGQTQHGRRTIHRRESEEPIPLRMEKYTQTAFRLFQNGRLSSVLLEQQSNVQGRDSNCRACEKTLSDMTKSKNPGQCIRDSSHSDRPDLCTKVKRSFYPLVGIGWLRFNPPSTRLCSSTKNSLWLILSFALVAAPCWRRRQSSLCLQEFVTRLRMDSSEESELESKTRLARREVTLTQKETDKGHDMSPKLSALATDMSDQLMKPLSHDSHPVLEKPAKVEWSPERLRIVSFVTRQDQAVATVGVSRPGQSRTLQGLIEKISTDGEIPFTRISSLCWNTVKVQSYYHLTCVFESKLLITKTLNGWANESTEYLAFVQKTIHLEASISNHHLRDTRKQFTGESFVQTHFIDSTHLHWFLSELWLQTPKDECWDGQRIEKLVHELCPRWIDLDWRMSRTDRCQRKSRFPFARGFPKSSKTPWIANEMDPAGSPLIIQGVEYGPCVQPRTLGAIHKSPREASTLAFGKVQESLWWGKRIESSLEVGRRDWVLRYL